MFHAINKCLVEAPNVGGWYQVSVLDVVKCMQAKSISIEALDAVAHSYKRCGWRVISKASDNVGVLYFFQDVAASLRPHMTKSHYK